MDYIFIGPGKTGSTWLRDKLKYIKDVSISKNIKETNFFLENSSNYRDFFDFFDDSKSIFDIGNTYIYEDDLSSRLKKYPRKFKLIIAYRNTEDRLKSMYYFDKRSDIIPSNESLSDCLKNDKYGLINKSIISNRIKKLIDDGHSIITWNFDNFKSNQKEEFELLLKNINCSIEKDLDYEKKINKAASLRFVSLGFLSRPLANFLREYKLFRILNFFKENFIIKNILYKNIKFSEEILDKSLLKNLQEEDRKIRNILMIK